MNLIKEFSSIEASNARLREFGLIVGGIVFVLGGWEILRVSFSPAVGLFFGFGIFLIVVGVVFPKMLAPLYRVWMAIGILLGVIVSPLILLLLFIILIIPMGLLRRVFGDDPLKRSLEKSATTYWVPHDTRDATHMRRPF